MRNPRPAPRRSRSGRHHRRSGAIGQRRAAARSAAKDTLTSSGCSITSALAHNPAVLICDRRRRSGGVHLVRPPPQAGERSCLRRFTGALVAAWRTIAARLGMDRDCRSARWPRRRWSSTTRRCSSPRSAPRSLVGIGYAGLLYGDHVGRADVEAQWADARKAAIAAEQERDAMVEQQLEAEISARRLAELQKLGRAQAKGGRL
jgi:hypothetical protein